MNRLACIVLGVAAALPAFAQQPAKPAAKPAAQASEKKPAAHKSRRNEDARACLERGSNTEIIKCAEAYL